MAQLHFLRSRCSAKVAIGLGLQAWASGTSRQMMDVLHWTGLLVSYSSISNMVLALADRSVERAQVACLRPHALAYDNVNVSSSIFVEQGPTMMSKVQSGTFGVIYELCNARPEDMKLEPLALNFRKSSPLLLSDLDSSAQQIRSYRRQAAIHVIKVLVKYVKGFDNQVSHASLQHHPRRPLPTGHKTIFHPLRASTIEEASIIGNLLVHDDIYLVQLKQCADDLSKMAIPSFNDQLTNSRIRSAQHLRQMDITHWERREIFQLAFGTFHLTMNLIWSVLETHRGSISRVGSLTHLFAVLEKTRLGGEHPDYHTLLTALRQILDGLILNAWRLECGYSSLNSFSRAEPTHKDLLRCAYRIIDNHSIPRACFVPTDPKHPPKEMETGEGLAESSADTVHDNVVLLTRDLLYVVELVDATAAGDFGRIEDILPPLACMFRGSGSNNYSTEILHLLYNLKKVWTPEFAYVLLGISSPLSGLSFTVRNIIRDNMLVNPSGLPGHAMGIDMNIEHLIRYLKVWSIPLSSYTDAHTSQVLICCEGHILELGPPWQHSCRH